MDKILLIRILVFNKLSYSKEFWGLFQMEKHFNLSQKFSRVLGFIFVPIKFQNIVAY